MEKRKATILVIILILAFFVNYIYPVNYKYPVHGDEYVHLAQAKDIANKGKIEQVNPYFNYYTPELRLERGFHIFLAIFIFIFRENFIVYFNILRNIIFTLNVFLIFYFAYKLSDKFYIGIFSSLFFILLKSSLDIQGNLFLLPLNIGLSFLLSFLILFIAYLNKGEKKYLFYSLFVLFLAIFAYPPAFLLLFYLFAVYFIVNYKDKNLRKFVFYFIIISSISVFVYVSINSYQYNFFSGFNYTVYNLLSFSQEWTPIQSSVSPIFYFGVVGFLFGFIGFISIIFRKQKSNEILIIWLLFSLIEIFAYYWYKWTLFIPFARIFFFYLVLLCILAGYGLYFTLAILSKIIQDKKNKIILLSIFVLIIFAIQFIIFYNNAKSFSPNLIVNDGIYNALNFIHDNYGEKKVVLADGFMSVGVFPITNNYVLSLFSSNLNAGRRGDQVKFFVSDCKVKKEIIDSNSINLIITNKNLNCDFTKLVYNQRINVYEIV